MENYYSLLGVDKNAAPGDIKRAFRERAKRLHPDIAGRQAEGQMRRLLAAYEVLSSRERRFEYDRVYARFMEKNRFDYRTFLKERPEDPASRARLVFFYLLHFEDDAALETWTEGGGLNFSLERYLEREDWMDCAFLLAEELDKRGRAYEAFTLLARITREERRRPYFRHFMEDVESFLRELVRRRLKPAVDGETYVECLETLLSLGFPPREESRWLRSMAEALYSLGEGRAAEGAFREALRRNPALAGTGRLRRAAGARG
ncbi:MAG: DnaJ domain-containing protein [Treponema sp.]|jgi:curved DNA-binding protein CbpA|nr:DnaJ domain-containing protein [Treponema sp.]